MSDPDPLFPDPNFVEPVSSPSSPSPALTVASDVFLVGEFIQLGVADAGSLGSQGSAPSGTITSGSNLGLSAIVDLDGFSKGSSAASTRSGDFFLPTSVQEGYVLGFEVGGVQQNFVQDRNSSRNDINAGTVNASSGSTNTAITNATFVGSGSSSVTFQQTISFDSQDSFFKTEIIVTNSGSVSLDNFRYMRTMNPNLDVDAFAQPQTRNDVLSQPDIPSGTNLSAINQAQGPNSQIAINLIANDGDARASNHGTFNVDVFEPSVFSSPDDRDGNQVDEAIMLTIDFGSIPPGAQVTKTFFTSFQSGTSGANESNDIIVGTDNADSISTGDGNDTIFDLGGGDTVSAGNGNDTIIAGGGSDTYDGEAGVDTLDYQNSNAITADFGSGRVTISGTAEVDNFSGIEGITGSSAADTITGGSGSETLTGGGGADSLQGAGGTDTFAYVLPSDGEVRSSNGAVGTNNGDNIVDFTSGVDQISISGAGFDFTSINNGVNFEIINAGYDGTNSTLGEFSSANPVLIYSQSDEALIYDDNGSGAGYTILLNHGSGVAGSNDIVATDIVLT